MGWVSGTAVFFMIWWTLIFCILPIGNKAPETPESGHVASAPINANIKQKFIATTILSVLVWLVIFALIESDLISFHEMAKTLVEQDKTNHP